MQVIDYYTSENQAHWLAAIGRSDWDVGQYLHDLIAKDAPRELFGPNVRVLLLTEGDALLAFCTLADQDDVPDRSLTPWVGFVYTFPQYRRQGCLGKLLAHAKMLARGDGKESIYISTNHVGLYERYGCVFYRMMKDLAGEDSRVYRLAVND